MIVNNIKINKNNALLPNFVILKPTSLLIDDRMNNNSKIHAISTKYFYYKILDKWLVESELFKPIFDYFIIDNKKALLNNNQKKNNNVNLNDNDKFTIIKYIEDNILNEQDVYDLLKIFVKETGIPWSSLHKNEYFLKETLLKKLKFLIKNKMKNV